jgi:hypothetical protein
VVSLNLNCVKNTYAWYVFKPEVSVLGKVEKHGRDLRCFGISRSAESCFRTAVSGQPIGPIVKVQTVKPDIRRVKTELTLPYKSFSSDSDLRHLQDSFESHNLLFQNTL